MNIYPYLSMGHVIQKLTRGLRFIWHDADYDIPADSALSYRRYQLGAQVMARLFRYICRPIATPETKGAFCFGLRTMAIDGSTESLPDTAANAAVFGRHHNDRGEAAFPQAQCVYLAECGTHAIVDAGFWPIHTSERVGGHRLLRSVTAGMLVMWDRGFHDYDMIVGVRQRQSHVLSRLPAHAKPEHVQTLPDGSWLAYIYPSDYHRRKQGERCLVRIIEYKVTDPALADPNETHRLLTTLLDPDLYPALDLICAYHERWEIEIAIDEIDTHQRLSAKTLRSLKPVGVIQELYGLLIAHFIIRSLMHEAALQAGIDPDQLSFVHAVEVIKDAIPEPYAHLWRQRLTPLRLLHPHARNVPPKLDDDTVMHDAVYGGRCRQWVLEYLVPLRKDQVGGDHQAVPLIPLAQKGKQHLHLFPTLLHIANVIEDDHLEPVQPPQFPFQFIFQFGPQQATHQLEGWRKQHRTAVFHQRMPHGRRQMRLTRARQAKAQDILGAADKVPGLQIG
jgi:hypothetical protein